MMLMMMALLIVSDGGGDYIYNCLIFIVLCLV